MLGHRTHSKPHSIPNSSLTGYSCCEQQPAPTGVLHLVLRRWQYNTVQQEVLRACCALSIGGTQNEDDSVTFCTSSLQDAATYEQFRNKIPPRIKQLLVQVLPYLPLSKNYIPGKARREAAAIPPTQRHTSKRERKSCLDKTEPRISFT